MDLVRVGAMREIDRNPRPVDSKWKAYQEVKLKASSLVQAKIARPGV